MSQLDIFSLDGHLTLTAYRTDPSVPSLILKDKDVYNYLLKLSDLPIRAVHYNIEDGEVHDALINYDSFDITLHDCKKLEPYGRQLRPLTDNMVDTVEIQNLERIKRFREENGLDLVPKICRRNKHTGTKIIAGIVTLAMLAAAVIGTEILSDDKDEIPTHDINASDDVSFPEKEEDIFDNLNINSISVDDNKGSVTNMDNFREYNLELEYIDNSGTDKVATTKELYGDTIDKYAKMYGLDSNLVLAIATQERGIHSTKMDSGGATGLMQVQNSVWVNEEISAHNFETGEVESFTVRKDMLSNVDTNIKLGCMILQNAMKNMDYNIVAAVQCYNMGYGNMSKILNAYASSQGLTKEEVLQDHNDYGWLGYRDLITVGDPQYVEHVFSWLGNTPDLSVMSTDNSVTSLSVRNTAIDAKLY